jgi:hypothetical protein
MGSDPDRIPFFQPPLNSGRMSSIKCHIDFLIANHYHLPSKQGRSNSRHIERSPIFRVARDYAHFREALAERWPIALLLRLHAYVLMENHYHLLIELWR